MNILINQTSYSVPAGATLTDAIALMAVEMPFAVAINLQFVPQTAYARQVLAEGDQIDIIRPVTGG